MLGVVADFMPSFSQQSTCTVSTNFNHTPSYHYWSQNPQETREEIHKCLFHTSLSLQTHPQAPHQSPAQQRILLGHDYKIGCVPGIKKKNVVDFTCSQELLPHRSNHTSATVAPLYPRDQYKPPTPVCPPARKTTAHS